jgi:hypothetical protein
MAATPLHVHNVFFRLADDSPQKCAELIGECHTYLKPIRGVAFFTAGTRVEDCVRDVNDTEFDVALTLVFTSREDHDAYQKDKACREFVSRNEANWKDVRVFDSDFSP